MAPLYPILNKRIPRRYLYIGGMISMIVAYVLLVLFYIPGTLIQMTAILSLTDSIEYGQLKNGKRDEAVTLSVRPMLDKIGGALSNGITGFIAVAAGMTGSATAADMTPANIHTFEVCQMNNTTDAPEHNATNVVSLFRSRHISLCSEVDHVFS